VAVALAFAVSAVMMAIMSVISVVRTMCFVIAMSALVVVPTLRRGFRGWTTVAFWLVSGFVLFLAAWQVGTKFAIPCALLTGLFLRFFQRWYEDQWR
jgi:hypothetical protein